MIGQMNPADRWTKQLGLLWKVNVARGDVSVPQIVEEAIAVYEDFTRRSADIWRFGIRPTLVQDDSRWVWKINESDFT